MQTTITQIEKYHLSHHRFIESYQKINEYVADLYKQPKKLVEDAGYALDTFCLEDSIPHARDSAKRSCEVVLDFMDLMDDFTIETIQLFIQHRKHIDQTRSYVRKISLLKSKYHGNEFLGQAEEFRALMPELLNLISGLHQIKRKADIMTRKMELLSGKWETIKCSIH